VQVSGVVITVSIDELSKRIALAVGASINALSPCTTQYPLLVGLVTLITFLFYERLFKNPFKLSLEELENHIAEARVEEERLSRELKEVEELLKEVESGKMQGNVRQLSERKRHLEGLLKLTKDKIIVTSMVIMVKERAELFNKLFGKDNFKRLLDVEKFEWRINEELRRAGIEEIDVEELRQCFNEALSRVEEVKET